MCTYSEAIKAENMPSFDTMSFYNGGGPIPKKTKIPKWRFYGTVEVGFGVFFTKAVRKWFLCRPLPYVKYIRRGWK